MKSYRQKLSKHWRLKMLSDELLNKVVELISMKPGKKNLKLEELKDSIERAATQISRFCRLYLIPMELKYILADMSSDIYDMEHYDPNGNNEGEEENVRDDFSKRVKSLKQGDTTIEFEVKKEVVPFSSMKEIMHEYSNDLVPYRGIYWR